MVVTSIHGKCLTKLYVHWRSGEWASVSEWSLTCHITSEDSSPQPGRSKGSSMTTTKLFQKKLQANPETMTSVLFMAVGNYWKEPTSHRSSRLKFKSIHKIEVHAVF
jgi:hypothetical protein